MSEVTGSTDSIGSAGSPTVDQEGVERLRSALEVANIPTLLLTLTHLTGDERWLAEPYRPNRAQPLSDNDTGGLPEEEQAEVRAAVLAAVLAHERDELTPSDLPPHRIPAMLGQTLDDDVPEEYGELLAEELGLVSRDVPMPPPPPGFRVLIIGAGMSGLCMAVKLEAAGIDYLVLEKDTDLGGTWWENRYPGCGVDTPNHFYSYSFAPSATWSRFFPKRDEVFAYLSEVADEAGVRPRIRFGVEVTTADYDEATATWRVRARDADGSELEFHTPVLVSAVGQVNHPFIPGITGLDRFDGPVMHTARWRPEVDLTGKRVAVIGTGASAMQLVPAIAEDAERVLVFQRTRQWAIPHPNYHREVPEGVRYLMQRVPLYARWYRLRVFWNFGDRLYEPLMIDPDWPHPERSINAANDRHRAFLARHIERELAERPDLVERCMPDYPPYVKRPLLDNGWFRTMARPDVDLITDGIAEVTPRGVRTDDGVEHEVDVIAVATGFTILQFLWPMEIRGLSWRSLRDEWGEDDARAYLGVTVPGFPNFFILNGPNTFAGHGGSAIIASEFEVRYALQGVRRLLEADLASIVVREDVFWDYNKEVDEILSRMIWSHRGTTTYFRNNGGRIVVNSPWKYIDFWARTKELDPAEYEEVPRHAHSG